MKAKKIYFTFGLLVIVSLLVNTSYGQYCISDYDCGSQASCNAVGDKFILSESRCVNGYCKTSTREVECCRDSDCLLNTYCVPNEGCKTIYRKCPQGSCCTTGNQYSYQTCDTGKQCCLTQDPDIGTCKISCEPEVNQRPLWQMLIIYGFLLIVGLVVLGVLLYSLFLISKKIRGRTTKRTREREVGNTTDKSAEPEIKKEEAKKKTKTSIKYCSSCGAKVSLDQKFCNNCGERLDKD